MSKKVVYVSEAQFQAIGSEYYKYPQYWDVELREGNPAYKDGYQGDDYTGPTLNDGGNFIPILGFQHGVKSVVTGVNQAVTNGVNNLDSISSMLKTSVGGKPNIIMIAFFAAAVYFIIKMFK